MSPALRVVCDEDCGNAPKKQLLLDLATALAKGDDQAVLARAAPDPVWLVAGGARAVGHDEVADALPRLGRAGATELRVESILTHGKGGAIEGLLTFADGRRVPFCDVYHFTGAKGDMFAMVTSYGAPEPDRTRASASSSQAERVLARVKQHVELWLQDKRMRTMGQIMLKDIARFEQEEAERRGGS